MVVERPGFVGSVLARGQRELAVRLRYGRGRISRIETGRSTPTARFLELPHYAYGVDQGDLLQRGRTMRSLLAPPG
jgi:transcriptional regulator with XRE-family HTH domain